MRVLIIDFDRTGLDMAWRSVESGHEVRWWASKNVDGTPGRAGDGFPGIQKVTDWQSHMQWAKSGIVINLFNDRKITAALDKWKAMGWPIFGPTSKSAALEIDREQGMKKFEELDFFVPKYHTFKTLEETLAFAWKANQPYVLKPMGDEEDKSLTYVAHDPADLVSFLEMKKLHGFKAKGKLMLQEKVDLLMEIGISGWVGKNGFLSALNVNVEHKKLMPGDAGPATGEMGTLCRYFTDTEDSILAESLLRFEDHLVELGHIGDFDIGGAIDTKGRLVPFEVSARFGWPSTFILFQSHKNEDAIEWMRDAIDGTDSLDVDTRCAVGVVMARPPFPYKNKEPANSIGYTIKGVEEVWSHVSPVEMMIQAGPVMTDAGVARGKVYQTTGDYVCCVTAHGSDVHDAVAEVYGAVERIKFSDAIVRNDIAKGLEHKLPKVKALGFSELPDW